MKKYRKLNEHMSPEWGLTKRVVFIILATFLRSGSKGVQGWSQGPSQGPSRVKFAPKWVSKWLGNHQKSYLQAFWKRFSKTRALNMFPTSSGLFYFVPTHAEGDSMSYSHTNWLARRLSPEPFNCHASVRPLVQSSNICYLSHLSYGTLKNASRS